MHLFYGGGLPMLQRLTGLAHVGACFLLQDSTLGDFVEQSRIPAPPMGCSPNLNSLLKAHRSGRTTPGSGLLSEVTSIARNGSALANYHMTSG